MTYKHAAVCRIAFCGFMATGTEPGDKPSPDDELCRLHRTELERRRRNVPPDNAATRGQGRRFRRQKVIADG